MRTSYDHQAHVWKISAPALGKIYVPVVREIPEFWGKKLHREFRTKKQAVAYREEVIQRWVHFQAKLPLPTPAVELIQRRSQRVLQTTLFGKPQE